MSGGNSASAGNPLWARRSSSRSPVKVSVCWERLPWRKGLCLPCASSFTVRSPGLLEPWRPPVRSAGRGWGGEEAFGSLLSLSLTQWNPCAVWADTSSCTPRPGSPLPSLWAGLWVRRHPMTLGCALHPVITLHSHPRCSRAPPDRFSFPSEVSQAMRFPGGFPTRTGGTSPGNKQVWILKSRVQEFTGTGPLVGEKGGFHQVACRGVRKS